MKHLYRGFHAVKDPIDRLFVAVLNRGRLAGLAGLVKLYLRETFLPNLEDIFHRRPQWMSPFYAVEVTFRTKLSIDVVFLKTTDVFYE